MRKPIRYTRELGERIAEKIAKGLTDSEAAVLVGIPYHTIRLWRERRKDFVQLLEYADALRLEKALDELLTHANGWQATLSWLERVKPKRFARPEVQIQLQANILAAQMGEAVNPFLNVKVLIEVRTQLNQLQAVAGRPAELDATVLPAEPPAELSL